MKLKDLEWHDLDAFVYTLKEWLDEAEPHLEKSLTTLREWYPPLVR